MRVNGADLVLREATCLEDYLKNQGYTPSHVAVERNGEVVPKSLYRQTILSDGDEIEIVCFVGGG